MNIVTMYIHYIYYVKTMECRHLMILVIDECNEYKARLDNV